MIRVLPYNDDIATFYSAIESLGRADLDCVRSAQHFGYFENYLRDIGVKTLVVENPYTDRDFLNDLASYYVFCHVEYPRKCCRVHFFSSQFTSEELLQLMRGATCRISTRDLQQAYRGFSVIKPLPQTVIGRTCVSTYPSQPDSRVFPCTRKYRVNLCGLDLEVESIAFQQQDRVVAACATSALWSAFHVSADRYGNSTPCPVQITNAATRNLPALSRVLPNSGLDLFHMAHAITEVGLEPLNFGAKSRFEALTTMYAYLRAHVPVLLGVDLVDVPPTEQEPKVLGQHAIVASGYSLSEEFDCKPADVDFRVVAAKIAKLYCHDDQVGPFARMNVSAQVTVPTLPDAANWALTTSWESAAADHTIVAIPFALLIPVYHKIRIPYTAIQQIILYFDCIVAARLVNAGVVQALTWDIYLTTVNDLKSEFVSRADTPFDPVETLLLQSMPKFLWRATASDDAGLAVDFIFDATDIEQSELFILGLEYRQGVFDELRKMAAQPEAYGLQARALYWRVLSWFRSN